MVLQQARFKVVGMYCTSCKSLIEKQLQDRKAIKKIDIDYMTDSVVIDYDDSEITRDEIKKNLENSGYQFVRVSR